MCGTEGVTEEVLEQSDDKELPPTKKTKTDNDGSLLWLKINHLVLEMYIPSKCLYVGDDNGSEGSESGEGGEGYLVERLIAVRRNKVCYT